MVVNTNATQKQMASATVTPLFRPEAVSARAGARLGRPGGGVPIAWTALTILIGALGATAVGFACLTQYTRKETANGVLRAAAGELRIVASAAGTVRAIHVAEGADVQAGQTLVSIATDRNFASGHAVNASLHQLLEQEERTLLARSASLRLSANLDSEALQAQIQSLQAERDAAVAASEANLSRERIAQDRLKAGQALREGGFVATEEVRRREEAVIAQQQASIETKARIIGLNAKIHELRVRIAQQPHATEQAKLEIDGQLSAIAERKTQYDAADGYAVKAPIGGKVSARLLSSGDAVAAQQVLLTISPRNSPLIAELYVPSRAIAFVRAGQSVKLRYEAFPSERFGAGVGKVFAVSKTALTTDELRVSIKSDQPVYRVLVALDGTAEGKLPEPRTLRSGMSLTADILLEKRSLVSWLVSPLLKLQEEV